MAFTIPKRLTPKLADQCAHVMDLRKQGATFEHIGHTLGISTSRAHQLQQIAIAHTPREATEEFLTLQRARTEKLLADLSQSIATQLTTGEDISRAATAALRALDQLNRLSGIYNITENAGHDDAASLLEELVATARTQQEASS